MLPRERGQALVIIVLVMAVVLTIALSVVSRSITDINISTKDDNSSRAFSAAEAGIEQALLNGPLTGNLPSQDSFSSEITLLASGGTELAVPLLLSSGETAPVWLVGHDDSGELACSVDKPCFTGSQLKVCWGEKDTPDNVSTTPAIEVSVLYTTSDTDFSTTKIARTAFDPHLTRTDNNSFIKGNDGECTISGVIYEFSKTVDLASVGVTVRPSTNVRRGPQFARLRLLYNTTQSHPVGVSVQGSGNFPIQGKRVTSTGFSGEAQRRLEVYQLYSDLPPVFDFTIFSGSGGIVK